MEIVKVCKEKGVRLLIGHHRRFSNKVRKLKELISSGIIGNLVGIAMLWVVAKDWPYFQAKWRIGKGGGPLLINGIHDIDNLRYVTGLSIKSVYAATRNLIRNNPVEDSASIIMETEEGPTINYFLSDGVPSPWSYELNVGEDKKYVHHGANCYYFFGAKGSLTFPDLTLYSYREGHYGWYDALVTESFGVAGNDPLIDELSHFMDVARGESSPLVTGEDATETLMVLDAITESAIKKQRIDI